MKVIGFNETSFTGANGEKVKGYNLYLATPISHPYGEGDRVERVFISSSKLAKCDYNIPCVGVEVEVCYNKYGKIQNIYLA